MQDQDSKLVSYSYDAQNRVSLIVNQANEFTTFNYDPLDRVKKLERAYGMVTSQTWDAGGNQTLLQHRTSAGVGRSVYTATYDAVGNRLTSQEIDGVRVTYAYDSAYQLIREQRSGANAFDVTMSYDPLGNRLSKNSNGSVTNYSFDAANQLTLMTPASGPPTTSAYDSNGNLSLENLGGAITTFTWNGENRLTRVDNSDSTNEQMTYGADGLRRKRIAGGVTTISVWDEQNVCMETNNGAATQAIYTDLPGVWGSKVSQRRSTTSRLYLPDFQGHIRQLANVSQAIVDGQIFNACGESLAETGSTPRPYREFGNLGYSHDVLGRANVRARDLRVDLGRWMSRDPLPLHRYFGSGFYYGYVNNRVTKHYDPSGLIQGEEEFKYYGDHDCGQPPHQSKWKSLGVTFISLFKGNHQSIPFDYGLAIDIYEQCCIRVRFKDVAVWGESMTLTALVGDYTLFNGEVYTPSNEDISLTKDQKFRDRIYAYYVYRIISADKSEIIRGTSFPLSKYQWPPSPAVVVSAIANDATLSHEIGHVLLNGGASDEDHDMTDPFNLMYQKQTFLPRFKLRASQCRRMRQSVLLT